MIILHYRGGKIQATAKFDLPFNGLHQSLSESLLSSSMTIPIPDQVEEVFVKFDSMAAGLANFAELALWKVIAQQVGKEKEFAKTFLSDPLAQKIVKEIFLLSPQSELQVSLQESKGYLVSISLESDSLPNTSYGQSHYLKGLEKIHKDLSRPYRTVVKSYKSRLLESLDFSDLSIQEAIMPPMIIGSILLVFFYLLFR